MSGASSTAADRPNAGSAEVPGAAASVRRMAAGPVRFVSFWAAVALPFLYVPLLHDGLSGSSAVVFLVLLAANALALVAGHGHRRERN
ncbi:hypothetical protein [Halegenticoccus soli]|uniref:hypothetical protein n=1 Tax=Halegenticoccus soli TaxID=1985678 RepID=UPI001E480A58|nr:hypothetical protein [Halegenticoccus soli]